MSKIILIVVVSVLAVVGIIIYATQTLPPKIKQPTEDLINATQPEIN